MGYFVYILSSDTKTLYIGVTRDLEKRLYEHRMGLIEGFTKRYNIKKLVYYEETSNVKTAIDWEKQLKGWRREKKIRLIESKNPRWKDLFMADPSVPSGPRDDMKKRTSG